MHRSVDKLLLISVILLVIFGFTVFISASLGLYAQEGARFTSVAFNQLFLGLFLGSVASFFVSRFHFRIWKKYSLYIFLFALFLTFLVFVPFFGFEHGGAKRWILLGPISFQPAELLKLASVLYFAAWLSNVKSKLGTIKNGLVPLVTFIIIIGVLLLKQPDTGTFVIIVASVGAMFLVAGARFRDILILGLVGVLAFGALVFARPYVMDRIVTFLNPAADPLGAGYQVQQSLIAIGSGGISGRGFGQSIQKFNFLPEPIGDSIFAVAAEEFGFVGSIILITLFLLFAVRGLIIASKAPDMFGRLLAVGIVIMIVIQSFMNIAAMLGVIPLSGLPLLFVSHGGTALLFTLIAVGILLNISKYQKKDI